MYMLYTISLNTSTLRGLQTGLNSIDKPELVLINAYKLIIWCKLPTTILSKKSDDISDTAIKLYS